MKSLKSAQRMSLTAVILLMHTLLFAQVQQDSEFNFSINIPENWTKNIYHEGTDKVFEYTSPDNNAIIQLRAFNAEDNFTTSLLAQVYEQSMLPKEYKTLQFSDYTSTTGIPGQMGVYEINYNGNDVTIAVFYAIQNKIGYVLSLIVPSDLPQKIEEAKAIARTFRIGSLNTTATSGNTASKVNDSNLGSFVTLSLDDIGIELDIPRSFQKTESSQGQSIWSDNSDNVKLVIQTIYKNGENSPASIAYDIQGQVQNANGIVKKNSSTKIKGFEIKLLTYEVNGNLFTYFYTDVKDYIIAVGYVSSTDFEQTNENYFKKTLLSINNTNQTQQTSQSSFDNDFAGTYNFTGRSDGKDLLDYWYITLNTNGTYSEKHQLKNNGYVSENQGTWISNGNNVTTIIPTNYGDGIRSTYTLNGNLLTKTSESGVVFTFQKE